MEEFKNHIFKYRDENDIKTILIKNYLTKREIAILKYICFGFNNTEIGKALSITKHTVKAYVSSIIKKLSAKNRTHAAFIAAKYKIIN